MMRITEAVALLALVTVATTAVTGCKKVDYANAQGVTEKGIPGTSSRGDISVFADPNTGCEYLLVNSYHETSITPRYEAGMSGPRVKGCHQ